MTDVIEVQHNAVDVAGADPQVVEVGYVAQTVQEGGGTPASSVVAETAYGLSPAVGVATAYAREDHTHGSPALGSTGSTAAAGNHNHDAAYAAKPIIRQAYLTSGLVTLPNTAGAWQILKQADNVTPFELAIPAAAGEYVDITLHGILENAASTESVDIGVIVGSSIVRYMSSGGASPTTRGLPWCIQQTPVTFQQPSSPVGFTVQAGDLDGGNVRFSVVIKAAGAATLYALSTFPFYWRAFNHRTPA